MNDEHSTLTVPATFTQARTMTDKVVFALSAIGSGTAEAVIRHLESLNTGTDNKPLIAKTREVLAELHEHGLVDGEEQHGDLVYRLHQ